MHCIAGYHRSAVHPWAGSQLMPKFLRLQHTRWLCCSHQKPDTLGWEYARQSSGADALSHKLQHSIQEDAVDVDVQHGKPAQKATAGGRRYVVCAQG